MLDIIYDMETDDPDDFLTLLLLLGHPQVNLKAYGIPWLTSTNWIYSSGYQHMVQP